MSTPRRRPATAVTRLALIALLAALGCGAGGGAPPVYSRDGDSCETDDDCRAAPEDAVVATWCGADGRCAAATSIEDPD